MDRSSHHGLTRGTGSAVFARLLLPLLACIGLALLLLGDASSARAAGQSSAAGAPVATPQLHQDGLELGAAIEAACELESENEDDDASQSAGRVSTAARFTTRLRDPRRASVVCARRLVVSDGLGRGPPLRRR